MVPKPNLDACSSLKIQLSAKSLLYKLFFKISPVLIFPSRDQLNIFQANPCAPLKAHPWGHCWEAAGPRDHPKHQQDLPGRDFSATASTGRAVVWVQVQTLAWVLLVC